MPDDQANLPAWVRRRDGSQVPFDADQICQSLYAAAESVGSASAFLSRELTDVVLHFLPQHQLGTIPTTEQIAAEVEKIVREVGQPLLAQRYAELHHREERPAVAADRSLAVPYSPSPGRFARNSLEAYTLQTIFSRDVAAAMHEGLLHVNGLDAPASLVSLLVETARLAELPWWLTFDEWRSCAGQRWIVESPEWLCTGQAHPALTPHLCERLLSLPMLAQRAVELHLNIAEPPPWAPAPSARPLFALTEDEGTVLERANFLAGFLERWKATPLRTPSIAWHVHERCFQDDVERSLLRDLVRQALLGKAIRFLFDRPRAPIALAEGIDRKCPGVLLEVGLDLPALAQRPEVARDSATFLKKLPSLARIAVSAAGQKRQYLRTCPDAAPLKRRFLIERSSAVVVPLGLDEAVLHLTGEGLSRGPRALEFALQIVKTLRDALQAGGRSTNLNLRLDSPALPLPDASVAPRKQLEIAGSLHDRAGAGTMTLLLADDAAANIDTLIDWLHEALASTAITRLQLQRAGATLQQGELPI